MNTRTLIRLAATVLAGVVLTATVVSAEDSSIRYKTATVEGLDIFYREAGDPSKPTILLLHGFPTSSHMFRNLIPALADSYHVVAPDYPGYGHSSAPPHDAFVYSFDNLARVMGLFVEHIGLERYTLYLQDYGAPIGYRIATAHPERVTGLIIQNGNAYVEGLDNPFWEPIKRAWADPSPANRDALRAALTPETTQWQYTNGIRDLTKISPDTWTLDQSLLDRPGNDDIQLDMFVSYGTNVPHYPEWQAYLREHQPPALIVWGKNDAIFPEAGAHPYKRDLKNLDFHLFDTGHFALEECGPEIAALIRAFMERQAQ